MTDQTFEQMGFIATVEYAAEQAGIRVERDGDLATFHAPGAVLYVAKTSGRFDGEAEAFIASTARLTDGYGESGRQNLGRLPARVAHFAKSGQ